MKHFIKTNILLLCVTLLSSVPFLSYAESAGLSEQEFADVCAENHAGKSRSMPLPPNNTVNYEYHYKDVLLSPDGESYKDYPNDMKKDRFLEAGQILMDMADGYEVSYEHRILDRYSKLEDAIVIEGKTITPYYRAVPLDETAGSDTQYTYFSNTPEEIPVIPDFPKNYDWKKHKEDILMVFAVVTVRSLKDDSTYSFESRISSVTNLYKDKPDCYFLGPTDTGVYTIKKGDSLQKIAASYYGNSAQWIYIFERNKQYIKNADSIYPGTLLVIPNAGAIVPPYTY